MPLLPSAQIEEHLSSVPHQVAQWRHSRTTPRGRIPKPLGAQAIARTQQLPLARGAKHLGLTPQVRKRRREEARPGTVPPPCTPHCVEVTAAWRTPTAAGAGQRPAGPRPRLPYRAASPALVPLRQPVLASR